MFVPQTIFYPPCSATPLRLSYFQNSLTTPFPQLKVGVETMDNVGGSRMIFACLAHIRVAFITEQLLFTEQRYRTVLLSFEGCPSDNFPTEI